MTTKTLFDDDDPGNGPDKLPPTLPHNGTPTSRLAAESMRCSAGAQETKVLEVIEQAGPDGLTDQQIEEVLSLAGNSVRPRRSSLVQQGRVKNSGNMRMTKSSRAAVVWVAVPPDQRQPIASKADWPLDSNPKTAPSAEPVMIS